MKKKNKTISVDDFSSEEEQEELDEEEDLEEGADL